MNNVASLHAPAAESAIVHRMSRQDAAIACAMAIPRRLRIGGRACLTTAAPVAVADPVTLHIGPAFAGAQLTVPRALLRDVLGGFDAAARDAPPDWAALILELALEDTLSALAPDAADLGLRVATAHDAVAGRPFAIGVAVGRDNVRAELTREAAVAVCYALRRLPPVPARFSDLPMSLHPRVMAMSATLGELAAAQAGDVFLPQARPDGEIWLIAGERFLWRAQHEAGRLTVTSARQDAAPDVETWWMQDDVGTDEEDHGLGQMPVRVAFELGRLELTLAELEMLGPGHVFELGRAEQDAVDILANGRRIGAGRLTLVGDTIGVQITRISGR